MKKVLIFSILLFFASCQKAGEKPVENIAPAPQILPSRPKAEKKEIAGLPLDIAKLAKKSPKELDQLLGSPEETKSIENGWEYRLYPLANEPKGIAVRFLKGKAKSFNIIFSAPYISSKEALKQAFGIDTGSAAAIKDPKEPLSEQFKGIFNGVKFSKLSAKKEENGQGFVFVLAEIAE